MPGMRQNGPKGEGAMTGGGRGVCRRTESSAGGAPGSGRGRGLGLRQGGGMAAGRQPFQEETAVAEQLAQLKEQYQMAQKTIRDLENKIASLEK